jgi:hypothetical protein
MSLAVVSSPRSPTARLAARPRHRRSPPGAPIRGMALGQPPLLRARTGVTQFPAGVVGARAAAILYWPDTTTDPPAATCRFGGSRIRRQHDD